MKQKIPTLFKRNRQTHLVYECVNDGCEWVLNGEGMPTVKWDGTGCMVRDGVLYKRYECKNGNKPPPNFEPAQDPDAVTGHWPGWVPVSDDDPSDKWHREAWANNMACESVADGTYELCGPKVQGNPHGFTRHILITHGAAHIPDATSYRTFEVIKAYLQHASIEGIVWHHSDGRMCKIKRRDFFRGN